MPYEFYLFVENTQIEIKNRYFILEELMLFEWTEIEIYMMKDKKYPEVKSNGDWLKDIFELNPENKILQLSYPVHLKNPCDITMDDFADYFVLLYRERETGKVQFVNLSVLFAWLIEKMNEDRKPLGPILVEAEKLFGIDKKTLKKNVQRFIEDQFTNKFILGYKK
jgi:hypothetical protein